MSPLEHGECFVLDDGGETDLDLGNYERFLDVILGSDSNLTTGKIYKRVIERERMGEYLGKTVQIIPHITSEIVERIHHVAQSPVDESGEAPDICMIELGGTIGDIESMPFVEALRQLQLAVGRQNFCLVHVSMVPTVGPPPGEQKTKPTQHSVKELRSLGLTPDFIVCRSKEEVPPPPLQPDRPPALSPISRLLSPASCPVSCLPPPVSGLPPPLWWSNRLTPRASQAAGKAPGRHPTPTAARPPPPQVTLPTRQKIGDFCNVPTERVLSLYDVPTIYRVPLEMLQRNLDILISEQLGLTSHRGSPEEAQGAALLPAPALARQPAGGGAGAPLRLRRDVGFADAWAAMARKMEDKAATEVVVALVGKYHAQADSYLSVQSSLTHACVACGSSVRVEVVDSELLGSGDAESWARVKAAHGILVPGGFGDRGTQGKIEAIAHARRAGVPFLGICLGMQLAVVEFARNELGLADATSSEFDKSVVGTEEEAVLFMPEGSTEQMGGTMRLGSRRTLLTEGSLGSQIYGGATVVAERHRHRYEVNPSLVPRLEEAGLTFSGRDETGLRAEVIELDPERFDHPFFFGLQGHPEYRSRPLAPSPPFLAFVRAAGRNLQPAGADVK